MDNIISHFAIQGPVAEVKPLGEGFINDTFIVKTAGDAPDYILQRKNHKVFPDVPAMMDNIVAVTEHIKKKVKDRPPLRHLPGGLRVHPGQRDLRCARHP